MKKMITIIALILLFPIIPKADIVVKYQTDAEMANGMLLKTESIYNIKGARNFCEIKTNFSMTNVPGTPFDIISAYIICLDKGVRCTPKSADKTYEEENLISLHGLDSTKQGDEYLWAIEISPINDKKEIRKFQCTGQIGKAIGVNRNDAIDTVFITYVQWSTEYFPLAAELIAYQENYARSVGVNKLWSQEQLATLLEKGYGSCFEQLSDTMNSTGFIPIMSNIIIERTFKTDTGSPKTMKAVIGIIKNELASIKEKKLKDKMFEIPSNYKKE